MKNISKISAGMFWMYFLLIQYQHYLSNTEQSIHDIIILVAMMFMYIFAHNESNEK